MRSIANRDNKITGTVRYHRLNFNSAVPSRRAGADAGQPAVIAHAALDAARANVKRGLIPTTGGRGCKLVQVGVTSLSEVLRRI